MPDPPALKRLPLFPLNLVLYPGMPLPLHIFEHRYRRMIKQCLLEDSPFGVILALNGGVVKVGCEAHVAQVVNEYDDGRYDVLCRGGERFEVDEFFAGDAVQRGDEVLEGDVRLIADDTTFLSSESRARLLREIFDELRRIAPVSTAMLDQLRTIVEQSVKPSFALMPAMRTDMAVQQRVLEMRSEAERLEFLAGLLTQAKSAGPKSLGDDDFGSSLFGSDSDDTGDASESAPRAMPAHLDPRPWYDQPPFCPEPMDRKNWYPMVGWDGPNRR